MKDKLKKSFKRYQYRWILISYVIVCILIVASCFQHVRGLVDAYNKEQAEMVTSLLVENINSELNNLVVQVERVSNIVLLNNTDEKSIMREFDSYKMISGLSAMGYLDRKNEFHGDSSEKSDLVKHGLIAQAISLDNTFITDPYRSSITGKYTLTIFVPVTNENSKVGIVYANLDLDEIASFASENSIDLPARICIINSKSLNYIACTDMGDVPAGSWNSLMIKREDFEFDSHNGYYDFMNGIRTQTSGNTSYKEANVEYTLGYSSIEKMPNWYVALVLENDDLSDTFKRFRSILYLYMTILFAVSFVYAVSIIAKEWLQRRNFQKLSTLDTMTGIYNKRTFEMYVEEYIASNKNKAFGTLIFVDVDDFKHYNDEYGHLNGDIVLKTFAKCLSEQFSSIGYVGRYGGDEFVVFVTGSYEREYIDGKINEIAKSLSNVELEGFGMVPTSFSAGAATCPVDGANYDELCNAADEALYEVKESGKGKFYWHR